MSGDMDAEGCPTRCSYGIVVVKDIWQGITIPKSRCMNIFNNWFRDVGVEGAPATKPREGSSLQEIRQRQQGVTGNHSTDIMER
eukprot:2481889-Pyramimonas_sp.AAC.1